MTDQQRLIAGKLNQLRRMRGYLDYSVGRMAQVLPKLRQGLQALTPEDHETLAAFRVRFSEFQEHLGKTMRNLAIEEEADTDRFGSVLNYMEKLGILDSATRWKEIRELRNSVNHEYEEDAARVAQFFNALVEALPTVLDYHRRLEDFCRDELGLTVEEGTLK